MDIPLCGIEIPLEGWIFLSVDYITSLWKGNTSLRDGYTILIIIIIIKKDWQCKAGRGRLPPYQSEDPSPTLPTYRGKEEKGKIVEVKKVESN